LRGGPATEMVTLRAADRTAGRLGQRDLRLRLERISRLRDPEEAQRQIVELAREVEALAGRQVTGTFGGGDANRLRYSGQVGDAEVEVRGSGSVIATRSEERRGGKEGDVPGGPVRHQTHQLRRPESAVLDDYCGY